MFPQAFSPAAQAALAARVELVAPPLTAAAVEAATGEFAGVEIVISSWSPPVFHEALLRRLPDLRAVFHAGGSVKSMVTDALWRRGIRVTSAAQANAIAVADFTISQTIFCLKHGWQRVAEMRAGGEFRREDDAPCGVRGGVVGLLSLGHTGRLVAERLRALDVAVLGYDPYVAPEVARQANVRLAGLDEVFSASDVVSCHTPLLAETTGMLRGRHFARLRRGAAFINTARGAVVNEPELAEVLARRPDLVAVLDVTWPEPPARDSPLRRLANVVLTPHIAGSIGREYQRIGDMILADLDHYSRGEPLRGEVTPEQIPLIA